MNARATTLTIALIGLPGAALLAAGCPSPVSTCTPGMIIECPCGGGVTGTQRCAADGTYGDCSCGSVDAAVPSDGGPGTDAPLVLDGGPDAFEPPVIYGGLIPSATSAWLDLPTSEGQTGLEAGTRACRAIGADHPCDYEEVVLAASYGQLAAIPMGTTAWLQRTTPVEVGGRTSEPGPGANCQDWTFLGNHTADGEHITFDVAGVPTYHFDEDTYWDGIATEHTVAGDLQCGGETRALLCCNARP
jgi:hypothetical protein